MDFDGFRSISGIKYMHHPKQLVSSTVPLNPRNELRIARQFCRWQSGAAKPAAGDEAKTTVLPLHLGEIGELRVISKIHGSLIDVDNCMCVCDKLCIYIYISLIIYNIICF